LSELSDLYSGYFNRLAEDNRLPEAFAEVETLHGRVEAQSLWYDKLRPPVAQTPAERAVDALDLQLLDATDKNQRDIVLGEIYDAEQKLPSYSPWPFRQPVSLREIQKQLSPDEVLLEYVLSQPASSVLTISTTTVHRYMLPSGKQSMVIAKSTFGRLRRSGQTRSWQNVCIPSFSLPLTSSTPPAPWSSFLMAR
jgi:hypothetical protein